VDSGFDLNNSKSELGHLGSGHNHSTGGILIRRTKKRDSPRVENGSAVIFDNSYEYLGGGRGRHLPAPLSLTTPASCETLASIPALASSREHRLSEEIVMPYIKLALAALILLGASLLAPPPGKAATYCPEGCFPCHPSTQQCCTYVGGRLLKCLP